MTTAFDRPAAPPPAGRSPAWVRVALGVLLALAFALRAWHGGVGLDSTRYFDERFSLHNVEAVLRGGGLTPVNAYYPGLSYLPQTAVLAVSEALARWTGDGRFAVFGPGGAFSPLAYRLCRLLSALYGVLSLWLLFRIGRRLFSPAVGLAAALLLAAVPTHVVASAIFKPDVLVVLLTLLAFDWSLTAVERGGAGRYLLAGAGIGLAVAAKYTGAGAALPLVAGVLVGGGLRRSPTARWRLLGRLALAAAAAVAAFALLNPALTVVVDFLPELLEIYQRKGAQAGSSHLAVLVAEGRYLLRHHGVVVIAVAAAGLGGLAVRALRGGDAGERRRLAMLLAYPLGYSLLYAAATTLFKGQNYLAVTAFTSLAAAWLLVAAWRRLADRLPALGRRSAMAAAWVVAAVAAGWLLAPSVRVTYAEAVPATARQAVELLAARLAPVALREVVVERDDERPLWVAVGGSRAATVAVDGFAGLDPAVLDRADAEVFPAARLDGPEADVYLRRLAAAGPAAVTRLDPGLLRAHGPALIVVVHPWRAAGEPAPLPLSAEGAGRLAAPLPATAPGELVSLVFDAPIDAAGDPRIAARVDGRDLSLTLTRGRGRLGSCLTPRFALDAPARLEVVLLPGADPARPPTVELVRWLP